MTPAGMCSLSACVGGFASRFFLAIPSLPPPLSNNHTKARTPRLSFSLINTRTHTHTHNVNTRATSQQRAREQGLRQVRAVHPRLNIGLVIKVRISHMSYSVAFLSTAVCLSSCGHSGAGGVCFFIFLHVLAELPRRDTLGMEHTSVRTFANRLMHARAHADGTVSLHVPVSQHPQGYQQRFQQWHPRTNLPHRSLKRPRKLRCFLPGPAPRAPY